MLHQEPWLQYFNDTHQTNRRHVTYDILLNIFLKLNQGRQLPYSPTHLQTLNSFDNLNHFYDSQPSRWTVSRASSSLGSLWWTVRLTTMRLKTKMTVRLVIVIMRLSIVARRLKLMVWYVFWFKCNCNIELKGNNMRKFPLRTLD